MDGDLETEAMEDPREFGIVEGGQNEARPRVPVKAALPESSPSPPSPSIAPAPSDGRRAGNPGTASTSGRG